MTYVLDTNIITAILKKNETVEGMVQKAIFKGDKIYINGISYYEIKRGLLAKNELKKKLEKFDLLCGRFDLMLLDDKNIFDKAAEIYANSKRKGKSIEDADILIASLTSSRDFILVSADSDFNRIDGLKIENWLN